MPDEIADKIDLNFVYTRNELRRIFDYARAQDVDSGGRYDARSAAINVWTHAWTTDATRSESTIMFSLYCNWTMNAFVKVEIDPGFALEDVLRELGAIEKNAIGRTLYGRE